jgi:hypothetical protein
MLKEDATEISKGWRPMSPYSHFNNWLHSGTFLFKNITSVLTLNFANGVCLTEESLVFFSGLEVYSPLQQFVSLYPPLQLRPLSMYRVHNKTGVWGMRVCRVRSYTRFSNHNRSLRRSWEDAKQLLTQLAALTSVRNIFFLSPVLIIE